LATDRRVLEETLLRNLRSRQSELTTLLADCSSHWGFEDPIYRFYHQSLKVFSLQNETVRIVHVLESLAPDRPLNPWFRQIVEQARQRAWTLAECRVANGGYAALLYLYGLR